MSDIAKPMIPFEFRNRAINCDANLGDSSVAAVSEVMANTQKENYAAIDAVTVEVSGRIFGLSMYDHSDYPTWGEGVFRKEDSLEPTGLKYTLGINDPDGIPYAGSKKEKYILPLIEGSHPFFVTKGVLKTGYTQRFTLTTIGNMFYSGDYIVITPSFYYLSYDGKTREKVDLYYNETIDGEYRQMSKLLSCKYKANGLSYRAILSFHM